jgi:starch phosphorylase
MKADIGTIAYFSMEVGIDASIPTYSGGLGVLAGDTLRAAADLGIPVVGVTLIHRKGYFRQTLDGSGQQAEQPYEWAPEQLLEPTGAEAAVVLEGREVKFRAWRYAIEGIHGDIVPVYYLDTQLPENDEWARSLTDHLYGGDARMRLCQEVLLGMGGVFILPALAHESVNTCHLNEGHSALLALALLENQLQANSRQRPNQQDIDAVRARCVFTSHTPVAAGHDRFPMDLVRQVLGDDRTARLEKLGCCRDGQLNMTYLGLFFSRYVNGVSMRHEQISEDMFPNYPFNSVTNGVHACTWTSRPFCTLYDQHIPEWRKDNQYLRYAVSIPKHEIQQAHAEAKHHLLHEVETRTGRRLSPHTFTIGFARRATPYKRADLVFRDLDRLRRITRQVGPMQILYGGKAHPHDEGGKSLIRRICEIGETLGDDLPVIYLEEYDIALGKLMCSGVDLWLNTPEKPLEASGTSGMKAALNAVPSLSVLDGWWIEGHVEGVTGWSVDDTWRQQSDPQMESESIYQKLEHLVLPMYYNRPDAYATVMRSAVALNGSFFNAQRMVTMYLENAYSTRGSP